MAKQNWNDPIKYTLRNTALSMQSMLRWKKLGFKDTPVIFGNAMPKSGSHLVYQILKGITYVAPFRYVEAMPIRMITAEGRNRSTTEILNDLENLEPGVLGWGYLRSKPEMIRFFKQNPDTLSFFVYRDPRDQLISSIFYAVDIHKGHAQHEYYSKISMDERIRTEILGRGEPGLLHLPNVREHYDYYLGWLECPEVLCLRFEDLRLEQDKSLSAILDFIEHGSFSIPIPRSEALKVIKTAIQPHKSATFRKGKTGGWRDHFTETHKNLFKEVAGDLLIKLGYEKDNDW
jgi:hypothetical protein